MSAAMRPALLGKGENVNTGYLEYKRGAIRLLMIMVVAGICAVPLLSGTYAQATINISIINNSQKEIRHVYFAPGDPNNWGPDQLNGSVIPPGGSFTLSGVSCEGSSIRVIAEDQNGCFFYHSASCGDNANWTITNDATADCGG